MPLDQQHEYDSQKEQQGEMSFFDHIIELRKHILRSVLAIAILAVVCFLNKDFIFGTLIFGPRNPDFPTYRFMCYLSQSIGAGESLCISPPPFKLITRDLGEVLMQHLFISFCLGFIGAFPFIFWQFWSFVRPGLLETERRAVRGIVGLCTLLFLMGVLFGYYVVAPFSISFLAGYTLEGLEVAPTLDSYVSYMTMFTLPMGLVFEMPILAYFLAKIGIIGAAFLRSYRRQAIVVILILAAIITPSPDAVSQTLVFIPLYALFEASIIVVARVQKAREKASRDAERSSRDVVTYKDDE